MKYIVGIDPGKKGAIALLNLKGKPVELERLPYNGSALQVSDVVDFLEQYNIKHAYIEVQGYRSFQRGVMTTLSNYGRLLACFEFLKIPYTEVDPKKWKKDMGLKGGKDNKIDSINLFSKLFPGFNIPSKKAGSIITHDEAEAMLIAWYGHKGGKVIG